MYDTIWEGPVTGRIAERVSVALSLCPRLLDHGSGTGLIAARLRALGHVMTATDPSSAMLARARRRAAADSYRIGEGIPAGSWDGALLVNVLQVARDPASVLAELIAATSGPVVAVWPRDEVSLMDMFRWDGGGPSAARGLVLRVLVGLPGAVLGVRRTDDASLRALAVAESERSGRILHFDDIAETGCTIAEFGALG